MAPGSGLDIYGHFRNGPPPSHFLIESVIDKIPVNLPDVVSEDELPRFTYPPIDPNNQIRLMTLLPQERSAEAGESMEPIQCTITVHTLSSAPEYEALSYTWGSIQRHMPISVMGKDEDGTETEEGVFATPQLVMALRRLRTKANPRRLWIDQLCIDQENIDEVGPQVQLMGKVYQTASGVVIWLGEDVKRYADGGYEKDSQHLQDLLEVAPPSDAAENIERVASLLQFGLTYHFENIKLRRLRAVYELLSRPWFRRAWVFQEASLARKLHVRYGNAEMDFEALHRLCQAIHAAEVQLGVHHNSLFGNLAMSTAGFEMINLIQSSRQEILGPETSLLKAQQFLCKMLQVQRRVFCYDARDRIFAFLAFQHGEGIALTPRAYEQPVQDIWRMAAENMILHSESLDIFAALPGDSVDTKHPSWLPNWTNPFPYGAPFATPISKFKACRSYPHLPVPSDDPRKLHVKGKIIDRVGTIFQYTTMGNPEGASIFQFLYWPVNLQSARGALYNFKDRLGDYLPIASQTMDRDLLRTLLADGAMGAEQPLQKVNKYVRVLEQSDEMRKLQQRRGSLSSDECSLLADYERLEDLALISKGKQVFFTEHGQLGLAPEAMRERDLVAIVHGSKTPLLLRGVKGLEGEYRVVGQCYLNGWMYGETPNKIQRGKERHPHSKWWEEEQDMMVLV